MATKIERAGARQNARFSPRRFPRQPASQQRAVCKMAEKAAKVKRAYRQAQRDRRSGRRGGQQQKIRIFALIHKRNTQHREGRGKGLHRLEAAFLALCLSPASNGNCSPSGRDREEGKRKGVDRARPFGRSNQLARFGEKFNLQDERLGRVLSLSASSNSQLHTFPRPQILNSISCSAPAAGVIPHKFGLNTAL